MGRREGGPIGSYGMAPSLPASPFWPGITTGFNALCSCTWAPFHGEYQVKKQDPACVVHIRAGGDPPVRP